MLDFESLGLREIIRLQNQLSEVLSRRFERHLALMFSDIVGSTGYFSRFGDEAGRRLQQRHVDLLEPVVARFEGRIVDTAGDGAFVCFPHAQPAAEALVALQTAVARDNARHARDHRLAIRTGFHWGPALSDGTVVAGEAVNLCARVAQTAQVGEIRLTRAAFLELSPDLRLRCRRLPSLAIKGFADPVELMRLEWRDPDRFPGAVRIHETGEEILLPDKEVVTFGRLRQIDGVEANDVILTLPDPELANQISRWHFELRREASGLVLHAVSTRPLEVDGRPLNRGDRAPVEAGTTVRVARVVTLTFVSRIPTVGDAATAVPD